MSAVGLIARREITTRLQQRGFRIGFGIALVVVVLACVVPALFAGKSGPKSYDVGLAATMPGLDAALQSVAQAEHATVHVHSADAATSTARVRSGAWDAAVLPGTVVVQHSGDAVITLVRSAYQLTSTVQRLHDAGLSTQQATRALEVTPLAVRTTSSAQSTQRQTIAIITVVVLFSQLIAFCTWVAMGVVEEKSSRVVELVLSSVRPLQLLAGKLLGIGAIAAAQVLAIGVVGLVAATSVGTLTVPASGLVVVAVAFVGFVLGFLFFAALAAALASTVSRQEEVSGVLAPVTVALMVCYGASFSAAGSPDSTLSRVLSIVPPVSAISMPARIARGGVAPLDVVAAVVLLLAVTTGVLVVAGRIYRASVLHTGTRVSLRRAWRGEAVADLA